MGKLLIGFLFIALVGFSLPSYAAQDVQLIVENEIFDDDPIEYESGIINIRGFKKVGFLVKYDETEVGNSVSLFLNLAIYPTQTIGSHPFLASGFFYDFAGGTTLQSEQTITDDGQYYFWIPEDVAYPYVEIRARAINTDTDDLVSLTIYRIGEK